MIMTLMMAMLIDDDGYIDNEWCAGELLCLYSIRRYYQHTVVFLNFM